MEEKTKLKLTVGIGASAGGLAALKEFVQALPDNPQMAFIIIQHLDPTHESMLGELLDKESPLPVQNAEDGQKVEADHIYVIPPDTYLEIEEGTIKLTEPPETRGSRKAIDHFFRSLARDCGDSCAGIVLSGSGSDGTAGLRAIKAAGGLALAQKPENAKHASMPQSAIDANVVDKAISVREMPDLLQQYTEHPLTLNQEESSKTDRAGDRLEEITAILKTHEDFNLHQYKPTTVQRRIARRMSLTNADNFDDYLDLLRKDRSERKQLKTDLMINVTDFFRDQAAFAVLEEKILPSIVENAGDGEEIRIWVAGCASGEEAYSIAILLLEELSEAKKNNEIKIFATDINEFAIKTARKGTYPDSIAGEVPENLLKKYFTKVKNHPYYQINSEVRDLISFAAQNVASDPPFSHMHLISCRNLLIYLKREVQEKVLSSFYFALEDDSYLFLGSSETLGNKSNLFRTTSKKWRIYQKIPGRSEKRVMLEHLHIGGSSESKEHYNPPRATRKLKASSRNDQMRRAMLEAMLPPSVVIDQEGQILYNHGDWKPFMRIPTGEPSTNIHHLVLPALRSRLRSAVYKVRKNREPVTVHSTISEKEDQETKKVVRIQLIPLKDQNFIDGMAIGLIFSFVEDTPEKQRDNLSVVEDPELRESLEQELAETREELQNTIEELETSTEELKASHEEALSTNEELQSANEELEASSEELRSLNEELSTVNAQLKDKIEALKSANNDLENFFSSTDVPTLFLDSDLTIQRYTPVAERLLQLGLPDIGRLVTHIGRDLLDKDLPEECSKVLQTFQTIRREKQSEDGRWFIRQVTPYRTQDRRIEGVVIVFQEITEIKKLTQRAKAREQQQLIVANLGMQALQGMNTAELIDQAVRQVTHTLKVDFCKVLKYQPEHKNFLLVSGLGWREGLVGKATVPASQGSQAGYTLFSKEPVIVTKMAEEKRFTGPELLTSHQVVSGVSCLINHNDPPFGVLGVHTKEYREFTQDDANFLVSVANLLSTALRTQQAQQKLRESEERLNMARQAANIGIHDYDVVNDRVNWDRTIRQIWGIPDNLETIDYEVFEKGIHPKDKDRVQQAVDAALRGEKDYFTQYRVINQQDQSIKWVEATGKVVFENGEPVRLVGTAQDITERKKTQQKLSWSERKLRLAIDTNNIGSFEFSLQKESTQWDAILKDIWGLNEEETPTQEIFWQGIHSEDVAHVKKCLEAAVQPGGNGHYHAVYRVINRKTEDLSWLEASGQTIFEDGEPIKMVGMIIDITERKKLENSLKKAVEELQDTDQKKNEFLSVLGHELRNPLTALKSSVEILKMKQSAPDRMFEIMQRSLSTMAKLLDDLLDLNRVSKNKIELDFEEVNLSHLLDHIIEINRDTCQQKEQKIVNDVSDNLYMKGDPTRLEQIFNNLIINACKYTPEGGTVTIDGDQEGEEIKIRVSDDGIGIDDKILKKVFEPFFQVDQENNSSGLGIGLALAKKLVELHHGTIAAFSEGVGKGATFAVHLPVGPARIEQSEKPEDKAPPRVKPGLKVGLIEDNPDILLMMPKLLETLGCEVKTAQTGKEGILLVKENQPEAMLIDIGLPDMTGHEVAAQLRRAGYEGLLIAVSGYSHQAAREKSDEVGFDHHLAKPPLLEDIAELLAKLK